MAKQITIPYEDKEYVLEYTRKSVSRMENNGFVANEVDKKPATMLPALFAGAFLAHHPFVKAEVVEEIFKKIKNKEALYEALGEMLRETLETLLDDPEHEGNVSWTPNW